MHSTTTRLWYKVLDGVEWPTAITRVSLQQYGRMPATGTVISYGVVNPQHPYSDTPPVQDGSALRRLGRRKVEEARFPLVTVYYGIVLGWTFDTIIIKLIVPVPTRYFTRTP